MLARHKLLTATAVASTATVAWYKTRREWEPPLASAADFDRWKEQSRQIKSHQLHAAEEPQVSLLGDLKCSVTFPQSPPSREQLVRRLRDPQRLFDVLVVGGGATGTGCALDAQTRGLDVALVEQGDFASATSSKSTKLAHGGVRYLEKAFLQLSRDQLALVVEALDERAHLLNTAPHLCMVLPIMIPIYNTWQMPYYYLGCKFYDLFAGNQNLRKSYSLSKRQVMELAPMLDSRRLKMGLVYHDGSFNDSRFCSTIAITAIERGATVVNYVEVQRLLRDPTSGKLTGAQVKDLETKETFPIRAKVIVNATGPYSDKILQMDNNKNGMPDTLNIHNDDNIAVRNPKMVVPSSGVHIMLPSYYCPNNMGFLDTNTSDGRVMFFLPWQGKVIAGTTDIPMKQVPREPAPTEADIQDILKELQSYINFPVRRSDVLSAWAGIRPLVRDPRTLDTDSKDKSSSSSAATQGLVRSHFLFTSPSNLVTIAGGKWTTYREMAEETIDEVIKVGHFQDKCNPCVTKQLKLIGSENWSKYLPVFLQQQYNVPPYIAQHLSNNYGDRAIIICEMLQEATLLNLPIILDKENDPEYSRSLDAPFNLGELIYCLKYEYVRRPSDFLLRRTRLAFTNPREAKIELETLTNIIGKNLNWNGKRIKEEIAQCSRLIDTFISE